MSLADDVNARLDEECPVEVYPVLPTSGWAPRYTYLLFEPIEGRAMLVTGLPTTTRRRLQFEGVGYSRTSLLDNIKRGYITTWAHSVSEGL